jgi:hypothetical protein
VRAAIESFAGRAAIVWALIGLGVLLTTTRTIAQSPSQAVTIAQYGEWLLTEELESDGRIAYRAALHDHHDNKRYMQWKCWPSKHDAGMPFWLVDEAINNHDSRKFIVTFNNSRLQTIDQFEATGNDGHVDLNASWFFVSELIGCDPCNPPIVPHDGPLFLAVESRKMEFNPAGAYKIFGELAQRCHF